jgi:hypothetical protein
MDAAVPILSYTELPPGSSVGFERTADGCILRFRRVGRHRPRPRFEPPDRREMWWIGLLLLLAPGVFGPLAWACDTSFAELARTLAGVITGALILFVSLSALVPAIFAVRGALVSRVKLEVTRKLLILHTGHYERSRVAHRFGEIARVDAINGRLSIRLIDGRGWLDGEGVGPFYFERDIRPDELTWLVRTLRQELGLAARSSVGVPRIMPDDVLGERP